METENLSTLKINVLKSQEQFNKALENEKVNNDELYLVPDEGYYATKDDIKELDNNKQNKINSPSDINAIPTSRTINGKNLSSDITLTVDDISDALSQIYIIGTTAPSNTKLLWIDTNTVTGGLRYYNGSSWVHVPMGWA